MSRAMQCGPNGIIWAIIQSAMIFPFIFGVAFYDVKLNILRILGICLMIVSKTHWEIQFENDKVLIYNTGNRQSYVFEQIKQSDFHIKQSQKQKAAAENCGSPFV